MPRNSVPDTKETRRLLVRQVAASSYLSRSSRLRDMFMYVCNRVVEDAADEIHEQEVGQEVFGRSPDYDTAADNTVRVHASMLRKRVTQYFENEGAHEPLVIEIPRGNYAPVFRPRPAKLQQPEPMADPATVPEPEPQVAVKLPPPPSRAPFWIASALAVLFAATSGLLWRAHAGDDHHAIAPPSRQVASLWSQIFQPGRQTDLVLGDASLGILQERINSTVALNEYFDRSYLNNLGGRSDTARLDPAFVRAVSLKRQANYGDVALLARMTDMAHAVGGDTRVRFARDYSFRELKGDNAVLFGTQNSNPWTEPFKSRTTLRWQYDPDHAAYYPVDSTISDADKYHNAQTAGASHAGYATLALLPNLSGTGNILVLTATGGTAMNSALDFLFDDKAITQLRQQLAPKSAPNTPLPYFEVLIRSSGRNTVPRDNTIVLSRRIQ